MASAPEPLLYRQIFPHARAVTAPELLAPLRAEAVEATEPATTGRTGEGTGAARPRVWLNMISTLDGRAALDGNTLGLGGPGDLELLLELRVAADAVLIGAHTAGAVGYGRLLRSAARRQRRSELGLTSDPPAVVISHELDLPWESDLFAAPEQPVLVYTRSASPAPGTLAPVEVVRMTDLTPAAVMVDLLARGVRMLLCEGGPSLNRSLVASNLIDDLFLTLTPTVTADDREPQIVAGPALPAPRHARLDWVLEHESDLFLRYGL